MAMIETINLTKKYGELVALDNLNLVVEEGVDLEAMLGIEPDETGGVAFRIGGATDVRQKEGIEAGKELLKERGRWASDIGWIYQRGDVGAQLGLSIRMTEGGGVATETLLPGWSQPALR